jgi:hypothetical protein
MWLASLVSQTGDRPCGRVAAAARRELSTKLIEDGTGAIDAVLSLM